VDPFTTVHPINRRMVKLLKNLANSMICKGVEDGKLNDEMVTLLCK
jgi:hypothetical protein